MTLPFDNLYRHGFARVAVALPRMQLARPAENAESLLELAQQAHDRGAVLTVFPELCLTGYSLDDLHQQDALLEGALDALSTLLESSRELRPLLLVGLPLRTQGRLFNVAVAIQAGRILGVVPKSYLPNYREYYEKRWFSPARINLHDEVDLLGHTVPFGTDLVFQSPDLEGFSVHVEICEDLWTPIPPSTFGALAGATVLCNLSASNVTVGKLEYRRLLAQAQSGRCVSAYVYAGAGAGESTTDLAWDGHGIVAENGELLAESERFSADPQLVVTDLDLERVLQDRMRLSSFHDTVLDHRDRVEWFRRIEFGLDLPGSTLPLERTVPRFPFVPDDEEELDERCREAYDIQVHGLEQRLRATGIEKVVIGVSGGLDSTQALIVAVRAMDRLGLPRENVLAYTMPGYATSTHTLENAHALMRGLAVSAHEIDIRPSCDQMLRDLGHPFADGEPIHDVTFENVQAGERTSHLFRLANQNGGLVLGTGDLSELALGWATYGVGDQMSHYNVNGSVPKTLIQHLLRWVVARDLFGEETSRVVQSIVDTEISPELVPGQSGSADADGESGPSQSTEEKIGPYELQDFHLYYLTRFGFRPSKVAFLALQAWADAERGDWPAGLDPSERRTYDLATIKRWLALFLHRFFEFSQFKRSAMPNGPKVGSGGSLSPRGDWRAPSDASAEAWLEELEKNVP